MAQIPANPPTVAVVAPETALDALLLHREQALNAARLRAKELVARFHGSRAKRDPLDYFDVVYGQQAVLEMFELMQRSARTEACAMDAPPYATVLPPRHIRSTKSSSNYSPVAYKYRVLYPPRRAGPSRPARRPPGGDRRRWQPGGRHPHQVVPDRPVAALLLLQRKPVQFASALRIGESTLVDALQELFEMYWQRAVPAHRPRRQGDAGRLGRPHQRRAEPALPARRGVQRRGHRPAAGLDGAHGTPTRTADDGQTERHHPVPGGLPGGPTRLAGRNPRRRATARRRAGAQPKARAQWRTRARRPA